MFRTPVDGFFPDFLRAQNMVRVIEGIENDLRGNENWFELSGIRVTEGKIGSLRSDDGDGNANATKTTGLISKTTILHVHHAFLYISHCTTKT